MNVDFWRKTDSMSDQQAYLKVFGRNICMAIESKCDFQSTVYRTNKFVVKNVNKKRSLPVHVIETKERFVLSSDENIDESRPDAVLHPRRQCGGGETAS